MFSTNSSPSVRPLPKTRAMRPLGAASALVLRVLDPPPEASPGELLVGVTRHDVAVHVLNLLTADATHVPANVPAVGCEFVQGTVSKHAE